MKWLTNTDRLKSFSDYKFVLFICLILRLLYLVTCSSDPTSFQPIVDSRTYHDLASDLARSGIFNEKFLWQGTIYPLFLSLIYKLFGVSLWAVKIIQVFIGTLTCYLTIRLGTKLFGKSVGLLAGWIVAFYGPLVFFDSQLLSTNLATLQMVALCYLAVKIEERQSPLLLLFFGAVSAIAILTRPTFLPALLITWLWLVYRALRTQKGKSTALLVSLLAITGAVVVVGPYTGIVHSKTGHWGILPPSGGLNLYIGNNRDFKRTINIRPGFGWDALIAEPQEHGFAAGPWSGQPYFTKKVIRYVYENPGDALQLLGTKVLHLVSSRELPRNQDIYLNRTWSPVLSFLVFKQGPWGFPFGLILPFAAVGLVLGWRQMRPSYLILLLLYSLAVVLVFVSSRYRAPMVPLIAILAAFGLFILWGEIQQKSWRKVAISGCVFLAVLLAGTWPGPFAQEGIDFEAEVYFGVGWSHYKQEQWLQAEEYLTLAVEKDPELAGAYKFLGLTLANQERFDEAVIQLTQLLRCNPDSPSGKKNLDLAQSKRAEQHYRRGRALEKTDPVSAMQVYEFVRSIQPEWPEVLVRIAWIQATSREESLRDGNAALQILYSKPIKTVQEDPYVLYVEAAALAEIGDWENAIARIEKSLKRCKEVGQTNLLPIINEAQALIGKKQPLRL